MMGQRTGDQSQLFYLFNLERRIPAGCRLRLFNCVALATEHRIVICIVSGRQRGLPTLARDGLTTNLAWS